MSEAVTPDRFMAEPANADIAAASPDVPALADIMEPPIMPPIPAMEMGVDPIIPFITPSDASSAIAVTIAEVGPVIPIVLAYCEMAAIDIP